MTALEGLTTLQLLLIVAAAMFLLMVILQTVLNRHVWWGYIVGLAASLVALVLTR